MRANLKCLLPKIMLVCVFCTGAVHASDNISDAHLARQRTEYAAALAASADRNEWRHGMLPLTYYSSDRFHNTRMTNLCLALNKAAELGNLELCQFFLGHSEGLDPWEDGYGKGFLRRYYDNIGIFYALIQAASNGHVEVMRLFLEEFSRPSFKKAMGKIIETRAYCKII